MKAECNLLEICLLAAALFALPTVLQAQDYDYTINGTGTITITGYTGHGDVVSIVSTIIHFNVTDAPTATWTAKQIVHAFPYDTAPKNLLRDRDATYGSLFVQRVKGMWIEHAAIPISLAEGCLSAHSYVRKFSKR
jgi:hypothetical protein